MAKANKKAAVPSPSASNKNQGKGTKWAMPILVLAVIAAVAFFAYHANKGNSGSPSKTANSSSSSDANSGSGNTTASDGHGTLSVDPGSQSVSNGSEITMLIYEDSGKDAVNAVQANLTYPTDKFDFVKIDTTGGAFAIKAQEDGGGGTVKIARGTINPVTSKQLVAKVVLKAKAGSGSASVDFANGSGIVRSSDNKEILQQSNGGTYTLTQ